MWPFSRRKTIKANITLSSPCDQAVTLRCQLEQGHNLPHVATLYREDKNHDSIRKTTISWQTQIVGIPDSFEIRR